MAGSAFDPIHIPDTVWRRDSTTTALRNRDIGALFRLAHQYAGASQNRIAAATGVPQPRVNALMKQSGGPITALHLFEAIADGLNMPDHARTALGIASRASRFNALQDDQATQSPTSQSTVAQRTSSVVASVSSEGTNPRDTEEDQLRRRTFHQVTATGLFSALLADIPDGDPSQGAESLAAALVGYGETNQHDTDVLNVSKLIAGVASAKNNYQACNYSTVIRELPSLLSDLRAACEITEGTTLTKVHELSAEAHQVAASILLKLDEEGLAWLATERSMQAAHRSGDPIIIGSSARTLTHALMKDRHFSAATKAASSFAARLDSDIDQHSPDSLSVYGALLLRGAAAAGSRNDRSTASELLNEAGEAGSRLGGDYNYQWTAFGPTNVQLHRVNIAMLLGDAGQAINEARRIDLDRILIKERKAALLIDTSRALTQWGKYEKAYEMLRAAEHIAPEEVTSRPAVHRLMHTLFAASPMSVQRQLKDFSAKLGVHL